eukprot:1803098-Pleurochrysis_carterae.AAC.1
MLSTSDRVRTHTPRPIKFFRADFPALSHLFREPSFFALFFTSNRSGGVDPRQERGGAQGDQGPVRRRVRGGARSYASLDETSQSIAAFLPLARCGKIAAEEA